MLWISHAVCVWKFQDQHHISQHLQSLTTAARTPSQAHYGIIMNAQARMLGQLFGIRMSSLYKYNGVKTLHETLNSLLHS